MRGYSEALVIAPTRELAMQIQQEAWLQTVVCRLSSVCAPLLMASLCVYTHLSVEKL